MIKAKKALSIVVALMLIINVFAVFSTAAVDSDYGVAIRLSTDKATYAAGETVTVSVKMEGSERNGIDLTAIEGGNLPFGWDNSVLSFAGTDLADQIAPSAMPIDMTNTGIKVDAGVVSFDATETGTYGWNEAMDFGLILDGATPVYDSEKEAFTISLKIADDAADGTYYYGIVASAMSNANEDYYYSLFAPNLGDGIFNNCYEGDLGVANCYDLTQAVVAITVGAAAPVEYDLKWVQNQWRESVNVEGAYDVGVKFGFDVSDIDIQFEGTRSTNVARVGAEIYDANGDRVPGTFESEFVYEVGTEYHYRVILEGLAKDDTTEYTIKPYLVYTDESLDVVYGETVTVCAADVIPQ